jgi:pimeloyl-ACP methyl ester carboxylesterase
VLVGHSSSGLSNRVFGDRYFDEVVGMVLVDPSHEDQWVRSWASGLAGQKEQMDASIREQAQCLEEEQVDQRTLLPEELHSQIATMSTRGINVIVPNAGHHIQFDRPQIVIDAVNEAIAISREKHRR